MNERLFSVMRQINEEIERLYRYGDQMQNTCGLPVGSEGAYEPAIAEALSELLREVRKGRTIDEALSLAANNLWVMVGRISNRRPKDINWGRWSEHGQDKLEYWARRLREVAA